MSTTVREPGHEDHRADQGLTPATRRGGGVLARWRAGFRRRLDADARYGVRLVLFAVAFVLVAVPFGFLLGQVVTAGPLTDADRSASEVFYRMSSPAWANHALEVVSFVGKPIFLSLVVIVPTLWLLRMREYRVASFLVITVVAGGLVDTALKAAIGRQRPLVSGAPPEAFGSSFPSGHAMSSLITYGAFVLIVLPYLPKRARSWLIAGAALLVTAIGFSRLALGMHFLSDVIAGYVFGLAWLLASVAAFNVWRHERRQPEIHADTQGVEPEKPPAQAAAA